MQEGTCLKDVGYSVALKVTSRHFIRLAIKERAGPAMSGSVMSLL